MTMKFGVSLPQGWIMELASIKDPVEAYEAMTHVAQAADEMGFDTVWLCDHFHTIPQPAQEITFECWTSTAALARDTKRIYIGQMTCNQYRNPALLAKMASTVDVLSHGRLAFGIGAGSMLAHEYHAYGYDFPDTADRLRSLREAVQVIRAMWTEEEAVFEGRYHQVHGAINQPKGVQRPHIPLLIAGGGEKVTLKLVAEYGDACNVGGDVQTIRQKFAILKDHCATVGRAYESIHRTITTFASIGETDEQAWVKIPQELLQGFGNLINSTLIGSPATIRRGLAELEDAGVQEVILTFPDILQLDTLRFFAREFIA